MSLVAPRAARPAAQHVAPSQVAIPRRLLSLDAVRGLAIVVMLVVMNPGPTRHLGPQLHHPEWHGLTFPDLFFPLFLFAIGVSMTLSRRSRDVGYVLRRAGVLFVLGVLLTMVKHERFGLAGVLQHIAVAYVLAYVVLRLPRRYQAYAAAGIVAAVWAAFVLYADGGDPWARGDTLAHAVDRTLLDGFTTEGTLQTVTSTATVVAGAFGGYLVREVQDRSRLARMLAIRGAAFIALGLVLSLDVPLNKRLWSPSFAALTIGTSFALTAIAVWFVDIRGARRSVAPLIHLGANPIAIYVLFMASLSLLNNHGDSLTPDFAPAGSEVLGAVAYAAGWTALWWLFAYLLYRRRIFIKI